MKRTLFFALGLLLLAAGQAPASQQRHAPKRHAPRDFYADGDPRKPEFALTFDDGPGYITEDLLKLLASRGVKATFFMIGYSVRAYPQRAKDVAAAGNLVGSHTDTHENWYVLEKKGKGQAWLAGEFRKELDHAAASIEKAAGVRPRFLRMPNGYNRGWARKEAAAMGYTMVNWSYGSDWTRKPEAQMTAEYLKALRPGAILLMHDGGGKNREKTLRIVAAVLDEARKKGLNPVRLDELLGLAEPSAKR